MQDILISLQVSQMVITLVSHCVYTVALGCLGYAAVQYGLNKKLDRELVREAIKNGEKA